MAESGAAVRRRSLPRGRHHLDRSEVEADQRLRIVTAVAAAMIDKGYVNTPVADVIRLAGVSRETYYRLFRDKLDGFLAALDLVGEVLVSELADATDGPGEPIDRVVTALDRYFVLLTAHRAEARLFLVEASAAGRPAIERRARVHERIAERLAGVLGTRTDEGRFACLSVVTSISALVAAPVVAGDTAAIGALAEATATQIRRTHAAGLFD